MNENNDLLSHLSLFGYTQVQFNQSHLCKHHVCLLRPCDSEIQEKQAGSYHHVKNQRWIPASGKIAP